MVASSPERRQLLAFLGLWRGGLGENASLLRRRLQDWIPGVIEQPDHLLCSPLALPASAPPARAPRPRLAYSSLFGAGRTRPSSSSWRAFPSRCPAVVVTSRVAFPLFAKLRFPYSLKPYFVSGLLSHYRPSAKCSSNSNSMMSVRVSSSLSTGTSLPTACTCCCRSRSASSLTYSLKPDILSVAAGQTMPPALLLFVLVGDEEQVAEEEQPLM